VKVFPLISSVFKSGKFLRCTQTETGSSTIKGVASLLPELVQEDKK
jgi:hypothetical protein